MLHPDTLCVPGFLSAHSVVEEPDQDLRQSRSLAWNESRRALAQSFEDHWSSDSRPHETPKMRIEAGEEPELSEQQESDQHINERLHVIDIDALRGEIESLSDVVKPSMGTGFHDESMYERISSILHRLRCLPRDTASEHGKRLVELGARVWCDRHPHMTMELVEQASYVSVELGIQFMECFQHRKLVDYDRIRFVHLMDCGVGQLGEASDLLNQLTSDERIASAVEHVLELFPHERPTDMPAVYETIALALARLTQGKHAKEAYRAAAAACKQLNTDDLWPFVQTVTRTLRTQFAEPDDICWDAFLSAALSRLPPSRIPTLLADFTGSVSVLASLHDDLPEPMQSALRRAFEDEMLSSENRR